MRKLNFLLGFSSIMVGGVLIGFLAVSANSLKSISLEETVFEIVEDEPLSRFERRLYEKYPDIDNWQRPDGPPKIALQVGHWKNSELPDELERLRGVTTGAEGGGTTESKVALTIAEETKPLLEAEGYVVDILPATVPPGYWADLFLAIHADGSTDRSVRGFKSSGPYRDLTERSQYFVDIFTEEYPKATNLPQEFTITRNMRGYYAFNWFRYDHAMHPYTTGVILETGFLTNWQDQQLLINQPELAAEGIANSVIRFINEVYPI